MAANTLPNEVVAVPPSPGTRPEVSLADTEKIAASSNALGFDLYRKIRGGNFVLSPASISAAMSMAQAGARGKTEAQMKKTLHVDGLGNSDVLWGSLSQSLQNPARAEKLRFVNRLFGEKTENFEPGFLSQMQGAFGAPLERVDFKGDFDPVRVRINRWVEEQTERRIKDLLPNNAINTRSRLVLVNAVYFLAEWQAPFEKSATREETFKADGSRGVKAQMMHQISQLRVSKRPDASMLELPYQGGSVSMLVLLPNRANGLSALEAGISATKISEWRKGLVQKRVNLTLPRFELRSASIDLKESLKELGMRDAFDSDNADFSGITQTKDPRDRLKLDAVMHKAFVKVEEKGTEAAAATAVGMGTTGGPPAEEQVETFRVEHPFLFAIIDRASGLLLFLGRINDPTAM
jgi:serpin B